MKDIMTGEEIRRYIGSINNRKSRYGTNHNKESKRLEAEEQMEYFLNTTWKRIA